MAKKTVTSKYGASLKSCARKVKERHAAKELPAIFRQATGVDTGAILERRLPPPAR
jgi:hypothetical protein